MRRPTASQWGGDGATPPAISDVHAGVERGDDRSLDKQPHTFAAAQQPGGTEGSSVEIGSGGAVTATPPPRKSLAPKT